MKKIAFLTTRIEKPSSRLRFLQYVPYLEEDGFSVETIIIPTGSLERGRVFKKLGEFDIVFLQKRTFGVLDWRALRKNSKRLIYDFDDAVMFGDSKKEIQKSRSREGRFKRAAGGADIVIAGNEYLGRWAGKYNEKTVVLPTSIDMTRYTQKDYNVSSDKVTLGWIGTKATLFYLENIKDALNKIHEKHPNTELMIVADDFLEMDGMPVLRKQWNYDEEVADLKKMDIGLMPLTDDEWAKGKCGFKLLQYMAVGAGGVASPVGVNSEIVTDGVNGLLASTSSQWEEKLSTLIIDAELRATLGRAARETVLKSYSVENTLAGLKRVLHDA